jgi:hypothetical protein
MPEVGFKPTIPVYERAKTVHALNSAATVIGFIISLLSENLNNQDIYQRCVLFVPFRL